MPLARFNASLTKVTLMQSYLIHFRSRSFAVVGQEEFDARNDSQALAIAETLLEACLDMAESCELWRGGRLIAAVQDSKRQPIDASALRLRTEARAIAVEERLSASNLAISRSKRLLERIRRPRRAGP